jgi:hypothetical protein
VKEVVKDLLEERYRDKWVCIVRYENLHIGWHIQFDVSARLKVEKVKDGQN